MKIKLVEKVISNPKLSEEDVFAGIKVVYENPTDAELEDILNLAAHKAGHATPIKIDGVNLGVYEIPDRVFSVACKFPNYGTIAYRVDRDAAKDALKSVAKKWEEIQDSEEQSIKNDIVRLYKELLDDSYKTDEIFSDVYKDALGHRPRSSKEDLMKELETAAAQHNVTLPKPVPKKKMYTMRNPENNHDFGYMDDVYKNGEYLYFNYGDKISPEVWKKKNSDMLDQMPQSEMDAEYRRDVRNLNFYKSFTDEEYEEFQKVYDICLMGDRLVTVDGPTCGLIKKYAAKAQELRNGIYG